MYYKEDYIQRSRNKSTRHKNWLLNPSFENLSLTPFKVKKIDKQVIFHITKKNGEKREVTMVGKLDQSKRSGISPFLYKAELFPEDAATQNIETTENGNKLKSKMNVLEGDETPEQLMIWFKDYNDKIMLNISLSAPAKLAFLRRLVSFEAQTILNTVESDYKNLYVEPEDVSLSCDYKIQGEITTKYTTDDQVKT